MPIGSWSRIYLDRVRRRAAAATIRLALDLMNGLPTIIIGIFVFGLLGRGHQQTGFAGSVALAIIMLPLIARASQEVLLLVPGNLREAADALGVAAGAPSLARDPAERLGGIRHGRPCSRSRAPPARPPR